MKAFILIITACWLQTAGATESQKAEAIHRISANKPQVDDSYTTKSQASWQKELAYRTMRGMVWGAIYPHAIQVLDSKVSEKFKKYTVEEFCPDCRKNHRYSYLSYLNFFPYVNGYIIVRAAGLTKKNFGNGQRKAQLILTLAGALFGATTEAAIFAFQKARKNLRNAK